MRVAIRVPLELSGYVVREVDVPSGTPQAVLDRLTSETGGELSRAAADSFVEFLLSLGEQGAAFSGKALLAGELLNG